MTSVRLSDPAKRDLRSIILYSDEQFRSTSAASLHTRLWSSIDALADSPFLGRSQVEMDPPGLSFRFAIVMRRFVVVCRYTRAGVRIARIVHGARNVAAELHRDSGNGGSVSEATPVHGAQLVKCAPQSTRRSLMRRRPIRLQRSDEPWNSISKWNAPGTRIRPTPTSGRSSCANEGGRGGPGALAPALYRGLVHEGVQCRVGDLPGQRPNRPGHSRHARRGVRTRA